MKRMTQFIKGIIENGNATLVESTNEPNVYNIIFYRYNNFGYLERSFSKRVYDREYIQNGRINPFANVSSVNKLDKPSDEYNSIICKLIKCNLSPDKSVVETYSQFDYKPTISQSQIDSIYNIVKGILSVSNHDIACAACTSSDYLEKYLLEQLSKNTNLDSNEQIDFKTIEAEEDGLMERIEYVFGLVAKLRDKDLSSDEYYEVYPEWIKVYEDRSIHQIQSKNRNKKNKINLLTTKQ